MNIKNFVVSAVLLVACGPDWGECHTCTPGEDSAEPVAGSGDKIPEDKDVTVIVNVNVNQTQNQDQNQNQTNTQTNTNNSTPAPPPTIVVVNSTPDAGNPPVTPPTVIPPPAPVCDAGTPTPPKKTCRTVCTCVTRTWLCGKVHKHTNSCKHEDKCKSEVTKCS